MSASPLRIAVAAYDVSFLGEWSAYETKLTRWVNDAAAAGARLLVFPEYAAMELASVFDAAVYGDLARQLDALQSCLPDFLALHAELARRNGVCIVAGSFPVEIEAGCFHNRAHVFSADGGRDFQDKLQMTRFENEQWRITGSSTLKVFRTAIGTFGINLCYDAEFPLFAHAQVAAGADLIVVPSCTDTRAGFERVRLGCRARAMENQCFVAHSSLVGEASWSPAVDINVGAGGVYTPVDRGYPDDGVLQQGGYNDCGWIYQDLDLGGLAEVRESGQVFNYRDWDGQFEHTLEHIDV